MKKLVKRTVCAVLCAVTALGAVSCGSQNNKFASTKAEREVVMTVGGREVQYQEFRYYFLNNKRDSYGTDAALTAEQVAETLKMTEENVRTRYALLLLAEKYGTGVTEVDIKEANAYVDGYRTGSFESDEDYLVALSHNFLTDELFRSLQSETTLAYTVLAKMKESGDIKTDRETMDAAFASDSILCLKEVYIDRNKYESEDAARERAEEALTKLMDGAEFVEVMQTYSDYDGASLSPEHGYYTMKYDALDVVWETAEKLAEGEHSYVIESEYGYHIVLRAPKDYEYMNEIRESIVENYSYAKFGEIFYPFMESLEIEYTEYGSGLDLTAIS